MCLILRRDQNYRRVDGENTYFVEVTSDGTSAWSSSATRAPPAVASSGRTVGTLKEEMIVPANGLIVASSDTVSRSHESPYAAIRPIDATLKKKYYDVRSCYNRTAL